MLLVDALTALNGTKPEVIFLNYNTVELRDLKAHPGMLFCDFAPPSERVNEFRDVGTIVLDHHKYARGVVEAFGENGVFGDEVKDPGVSGAVLAYREVWEPVKKFLVEQRITDRMWLDTENAAIARDLYEHEAENAKKFATLIGIRDTWQRQDPRWDEACKNTEVVRFYPPQEWMIDRPFSYTKYDWWRNREEVGQLLINKTKDRVEKGIKSALQFTVQGVRVTVLSGTSSITSDSAEALGDTTDFVVGFHYPGIEEGKAKIVFSTRSHTDFDCGKFCKSLGGGGHTKAAGFTVPFDPFGDTPNPYQLIRSLLDTYLNGTAC